jgi:hypothetical protein
MIVRHLKKEAIMKRTLSEASRKRRKFWENHLGGWRASGLCQAGYCRKHGLSNKSFVYWKKRLTAARAEISLVEVPRLQSTPVLSPLRPLRLMLGNRYGIEIERGFDEETLDRLLRVLEKR